MHEAALLPAALVGSGTALDGPGPRLAQSVEPRDACAGGRDRPFRNSPLRLSARRLEDLLRPVSGPDREWLWRLRRDLGGPAQQGRVVAEPVRSHLRGAPVRVSGRADAARRTRATDRLGGRRRCRAFLRAEEGLGLPHRDHPLSRHLAGGSGCGDPAP